MVPAAYVRLDALPLTPNGKVDRRALPAPEGDAFAARGYEAPSGEAEEAVAAIWAELLGAERVGRRDHFFELGGHSLLAVRVVSRVRQALGVEASAGRRVRAARAGGLRAGAGDRRARGSGRRSSRVDRAGDVPLSFAQQRLWFLEQLGNLGSTYHIPMRLRLRGELDRGALVRSLDRIVAPSRGAADDLPRGGWRAGPAHRPGRGERVPAGGARPPCLAGRGGRAAPPDVRRGGRALRPGARAAGPRAAGAHGGGRPRAAADDAPHRLRRLVDGRAASASWARCTPPSRAASPIRSRRCRCSTPTTPCGTAAGWKGPSWRRRRSTGPQTLAGAPELLELPTDHPRPARQDFAGASLEVELDEALTAALQDAGAAARRHPVHDAAGRVGGRARPALGAGRRGDRHAERQPRAGRRSRS